MKKKDIDKMQVLNSNNRFKVVTNKIKKSKVKQTDIIKKNANANTTTIRLNTKSKIEDIDVETGEVIGAKSGKSNNKNSIKSDVKEVEPTHEDIEITLETLHLYKESGYDPTSRSIFIWGPIDEEASHHFITSVGSIIRINPSSESIKLYINSPGGDIYDMFAIIDYMNYIHSKLKIKIDVIASGKVMSAAAYITALATGRRYIFPNTTLLLHEIQSFSSYDNTTNKKEDLQHTIDLEDKMITMFAARTKKKSVSYWKKEIERKDKIYYAGEAKTLGIVDEILN